MPETTDKVERLPVEYTDKEGKRRSVVLKARVFGADDEVQGASSSGDACPYIVKQASNTPGASNAQEEDPYQVLAGRNGQIIAPPYDLDHLATATEYSSELGQNIRALVTNTVKFGWTLKETAEFTEMDDEEQEAHSKPIKDERRRLRAQLTAVHPKLSLTAIRSKAKFDKHLMGNGYLELIRSPSDKLTGLSHVHGHTVRLTTLDPEPVNIKVPVVVGFKIEQREMPARFRKFVQMRGAKLVWFKEAGDPRDLDKETGEYAKGDKRLDFSKRATELIHHRVYSPHTPYGVPEWIGALYQFYGTRAAEELNFNTLRNPMPSMFVIVENGVLTPGSIARLKEFIEQTQRSSTATKAIILEGESGDDGALSPQQFKIRVEPLTAMQVKDELYQEFTKNGRDTIRQTFRIPPIFVGRSDDYSRATADVSRDIADEQVFAPDRNEDDEPFNRWVVIGGWGSVYHVLRSRNPDITSDETLVKMASALEKSGGMTPRIANQIARDVLGQFAPMPHDIDPDVPYSLQFARAQGGGEPMTQRLVENMIDMRKRLEGELADRFWSQFDED
jgi:PBSX family phage portal protein